MDKRPLSLHHFVILSNPQQPHQIDQKTKQMSASKVELARIEAVIRWPRNDLRDSFV